MSRLTRLVSRIETEPAAGRVRVLLDDVVLAESDRALVLHERAHRDRYYLPREDVTAPIEPHDKRTTCPFKGDASHLTVGGHEAIAWTYLDPKPDVAQIAGLVAFYDERLKLEIAPEST